MESSIFASIGSEIVGIMSAVSICMFFVLLLVRLLPLFFFLRHRRRRLLRRRYPSPHRRQPHIPRRRLRLRLRKARRRPPQRPSLRPPPLHLRLLPSRPPLLLPLPHFSQEVLHALLRLPRLRHRRRLRFSLPNPALLHPRRLPHLLSPPLQFLRRRRPLALLRRVSYNLAPILPGLSGDSCCHLFARLPEWTTWSLLVALALYDLVAVLAPGGPLKLLVELASSRDEELPTFLFDARPTVLRREADILGPPLELLVSDSGNVELQMVNWMSRESRVVVDEEDDDRGVDVGGEFWMRKCLLLWNYLWKWGMRERSQVMEGLSLV